MAALLGVAGGSAGRHGRQRPHQDVADVAAALGPPPGVSPPTSVANRCKTPLAVWLARLGRQGSRHHWRVGASSRDLVARTTSIAARSLAVKAGGLGCRWRSCCSVARTGSQWERRRGAMQAKCSFAKIFSHSGVAVTISAGHVILRCAILACANATGEAAPSIWPRSRRAGFGHFWNFSSTALARLARLDRLARRSHAENFHRSAVARPPCRPPPSSCTTPRRPRALPLV